MPVSRMRMRPWLEQMIDSGKIPGLAWTDEEKTMFTIPWKHAARHGWEMDKDACLFKEWAIHTGKYSSGQACDPKTWKANFRCAMNSLPDIEEVKDWSVNKGHQAKRVFRMLPVAQKSRDKRSKARELKLRKKVKSEDESDYSDTHSPAAKSMLGELSSSEEGSVDLEVQDFATIEVGAESTSNYKFQVSPSHSDEEDFNNIIAICKQLENDTELNFSNGYAYASPETTWSDSSSDIDSSPQYTTLQSDFDLFSDNLWSSYLQPVIGASRLQDGACFSDS